MKADVIVFDPQTVRDTTTRENTYSYAEGIDYVLVNGAAVIELGKHSGTCSGRFLHKIRY